ncbi:hypothetical protein Vretimale_9393 [Volvox reticuliferus]|nr:hypothetical protein Vretimale_9393 [Volvox reticuliferus]
MEAFAAQAGVHAGSGEHGVGALIGGGGGVGATSGPSRSPAQRVLAQRLVSYVAGACVQALGRLQHVLQELANAPATTQSSALDVLVTQRQGGEGLGGGGGGSGGARESLRDGLLRRRHRGPGGVGGGGLTARERAAYLKEEYQKMWDAMQEEFQQLLADLLQVGGGRGRPTRRPGRGPTRQGVADGAAGGGGGQEYGALGGVRSLLSDLNPVHFLEQLAALAERTADLAESALGGGAGGGGPGPGGGTPQGARPQPQPPQQQQQTQPQQQQQQKLPAPRRPPGSGRLTFGFDVTIPGLSGDQAQIGAVGALRSRDNDARGYTSLLQRALGDSPGSVYLLPDVYLPVLRLISGAEELLRLPPDLQGTAAGGGGGAANGPATSSLPPSISSSPSGPPLVSSWIQHYLDEVVLEQLLPQVWVELRGRCTAALEDAEAFRAQVGFSAAAASAATLETAAGGAATAPAGSGGAAASATTVSAISLRSVVPIARFIEVVLQELMASAAALPPFTSAFLAIAERILDRMLGAFMHVVRLLSADCPSTRLVSRSDVCLAMAAEGDALLLREPVAFAPQPNALPGAAAAATATAAGGGSGTSASASDLVGFLVSLRSQERPVLVPPQVRPLGTGGGGRGSGYGFAADGDTAEVELQYFAMRERPVGHERLVFGQGGSDRAVHLAAMSESLDYVAEAVIRLTANVANEAGGGGSGPQRGGDLRRGSNRAAQHLQPGAAIVPDLLLPAVQSYKALSGHCCRLLRLEALLLVGSHLAPVAATSHVCEEVDSMELHPSLGALTRAALRSSEDLTPFLQPAKRAYVLGPIAVAAARGIMWLLPAIHDISSLGVERMIRALSLLQPPLTSLVDIESSSGAVAAIAASGARAAGAAGAGGGASAAAASGTATGNAAVAAAAAAAALATAVPTVSGPGPSAGVLAALLVQPETRGERGRAFDKARTYYGLLLVPPDEVVRAATERPGRFLYAEWMALLQARVPHRTVTDLALGGLQRCLDRAYGLTPGAKVAEVVGAVVGAVQAPAERLGDVLLEGLVAGKDALLEGLVAGRDTLVAGVRVPAQTLQRVFKRIGAGARGGAAARSGAISGNGGDGGVEVGSNLYRQSTDKGR